MCDGGVALGKSIDSSFQVTDLKAECVGTVLGRCAGGNLQCSRLF